MSQSALESVGSGTAATDRRLAVGAVDVLLVAGLLTYGTVSHGASPLQEPLYVLETVTPFVAGWLLVSVVAGCYAADVLEDVTRAVAVTAVAWLAAANVGLILRTSPVFGETAVWPFNLVVTGLGLVVLVPWRAGYAQFVGR